MTQDELERLFRDDEDEEIDHKFLEFDRIENKRSTRPDLHAFLLLDSILPASRFDIVSATSHDIIYLDVRLDVLAERITAGQVLELRRCGVILQDDLLAMYA